VINIDIQLNIFITLSARGETSAAVKRFCVDFPVAMALADALVDQLSISLAATATVLTTCIRA
jgi:hypothetical protein